MFLESGGKGRKKGESVSFSGGKDLGKSFAT